MSRWMTLATRAMIVRVGRPASTRDRGAEIDATTVERHKLAETCCIYTRAYTGMCVGGWCWLRGNERMIDRSIDRKSAAVCCCPHQYRITHSRSREIYQYRYISLNPHQQHRITFEIEREISISISTIPHLIRVQEISISIHPSIDINNTASHLSSGDIDIDINIIAINNTASHSSSIER